MDFFSELISLTPIQHLIKYWLIWGGVVVVLFSNLVIINKKKPE